MNFKELEKAVLGVMTGKQQDQVEEAKKQLHPNQQKIDVHEPEKDEITSKDFEMLRKGKKVAEDVEKIDEISLETMKSARDKLKGKAWDAHMDDNKYGERHYKGRALYMNDRIKQKERQLNKEESEEQYDEIIEKLNDFEIEVKESYTFAECLDIAKQHFVEEDVVAAADAAFRAQDMDFFVEMFTRSDIDSKINMYAKAGHKVSMPKYSTQGGKPRAEYVVTDKETGVRRRYIHHGSTRKVENLGPVGKKDEE